MDVTEAVATRRSVRAFTDEPLADEVLVDLVAKASRAPSGGNVQPWRIYVIGSGTMPSLLAHLDERPMESPGYEVYPAGLWEPYRTNRFSNGEQLYASIGIPREDKAGRLGQLFQNYRFFGAPAAIFCFVDRRMGPPQWSDLGMFLQTFMLLATEAGYATCAQEAWTVRSGAVTEFVGAPEEELLFCGIAIGKEDTSAPINTLVTDRMPLDQWVTVVAPPA